MNAEEKYAQISVVAKAFSPSAPIDQMTLFSGRISQVGDVINVIHQRGQHAVMFGERGVGKTSLSKVVMGVLGKELIHPECGTINCDPTFNFSSLWKAVFREIKIVQKKNLAGFAPSTDEGEIRLDSLLPDRVSPDDIRVLLEKLGKTLIVIDEVDRLQDKNTTTLLADTIKNLSDHAVDTTIVLVGVADSVETLIAEHASIERAIVQIRMPRMSRKELFEIIDKGLAAAGMTISTEARERIAKLSQGLPHYTHLLALHAAQDAVRDDRLNVQLSDTRSAIQRALKQAQHSTASDYHRATLSPRENLYKQVLLACGLAETDSMGYFSAGDLRDPMMLIMGKPYEIPAFSQHLNAFCEKSRGPVLQRVGTPRRYRFRFTNPLMQPYVILNGLQNGLISEDSMAALAQPKKNTEAE